MPHSTRRIEGSRHHPHSSICGGLCGPLLGYPRDTGGIPSETPRCWPDEFPTDQLSCCSTRGGRRQNDQHPGRFDLAPLRDREWSAVWTFSLGLYGLRMSPRDTIPISGFSKASPRPLANGARPHMSRFVDCIARTSDHLPLPRYPRPTGTRRVDEAAIRYCPLRRSRFRLHCRPGRVRNVSCQSVPARAKLPDANCRAPRALSDRFGTPTGKRVGWRYGPSNRALHAPPSMGPLGFRRAGARCRSPSRERCGGPITARDRPTKHP